MDFNYTADAKQLRQYPTWRMDYNLTPNHRLSYTSYFQEYTSYPDTLNNAEPRFPGFPVAGGQNSSGGTGISSRGPRSERTLSTSS